MMKGLCDVEAPPERVMSPRHVIACHLDEAILRAMEPVITIESHEPAVEAQPEPA